MESANTSISLHVQATGFRIIQGIHGALAATGVRIVVSLTFPPAMPTTMTYTLPSKHSERLGFGRGQGSCKAARKGLPLLAQTGT